jgi:hypothetical protein
MPERTIFRKANCGDEPAQHKKNTRIVEMIP